MGCVMSPVRTMRCIGGAHVEAEDSHAAAAPRRGLRLAEGGKPGTYAHLLERSNGKHSYLPARQTYPRLPISVSTAMGLPFLSLPIASALTSARYTSSS